MRTRERGERLRVTKSVTVDFETDDEVTLVAVSAPRSHLGGKILGLGIVLTGFGGCNVFGAASVPSLMLVGLVFSALGGLVLVEGFRRYRQPWGLSTRRDEEHVVEVYKAEARDYRTVDQATLVIDDEEHDPTAIKAVVVLEALEGTRHWTTLLVRTSTEAIELFPSYAGPREDLAEAAEALATALSVELVDE